MFESLYADHKHSEDKKSRLREESKQRRLEEARKACTFQPDIRATQDPCRVGEKSFRRQQDANTLGVQFKQRALSARGSSLSGKDR